MYVKLMQRINVFINDSDYRYLKSIDENMSDIVRRAVRDYVRNLKGINASLSESVTVMPSRSSGSR